MREEWEMAAECVAAHYSTAHADTAKLRDCAGRHTYLPRLGVLLHLLCLLVVVMAAGKMSLERG